MTNTLKTRTARIILFTLFTLLTAGCIGPVHSPDLPPLSPSGPSSSDQSVSGPASGDSSVALEPKEKAHEPILADDPSAKQSIGEQSVTSLKSSILGKQGQIKPRTLTAQPATPPTIKFKTPPIEAKKPQTILDEALDYCELAQSFWQQGELEAALEALDQAYSLILGLNGIETRPDLVQQKEDLRYLISRRILEIYASRHIVVNGDYKAIPININRHVQTEIDLFTKGVESKFFKAAYQRSGRYRPYILQELKKAGMPEELSWLPLIESGYKVNALSKARALGLWQFIPSTGYKFGLTRNTYLDNRLDPAKATRAAIAYLKELHQIFGDWSTVLAAYNCGEGRVLQVIRSQNINYLDNFWDLYERLPRETARYVPRFIATLYIMQNRSKYGLDSVPVDVPLPSEIKTISKRVHLKQVAKAINIPYETLKSLNPELRYQVTPPEPYTLRVPAGMGSALVAKINAIPAYRSPQPKYVYHRVRRGETVSTIARKYRTSAKRIAQANRLNRRYTIVAGKSLKIPVKGSVAVRSSTSHPQVVTATTHHRVRKGDSLWNIARRYQTTVNGIKRLNGLKGTSLSIGQVLIVKGTAKTAAPSRKDMRSYHVKAGDSPYQIAKRNQMSLGHFLEINRLTPRSKIYPGQKVYVE